MFLIDFSENQFSTEIFSPEHTFRIDINYKKYLNIDDKINLSGVLNGKLGIVSSQEIDDFFYYFNGGFSGLKGFTYYDTTLYGANFGVKTNT